MFALRLLTILFLLSGVLSMSGHRTEGVVKSSESNLDNSNSVYTESEISGSDTLSTTLPDFVLTAPEREGVISGQELTGKELERLSALNVADAVRYFSGAQIKDYGGVGGVKTLDVRSMGTNHLGVFYDGVALGNAQNGQIDLGRYSLDNIEQISLYNGQKSELFATAKDLSSASSLYLRSRRPKFIGNKRFNLRVRMRGGSFGLINPSLNFECRINRHLSMVVNVEYTRAHGRYKFRYKGFYKDGSIAWDTTAVRHNGDVEALRTEGVIFGNMINGRYMVRGYFYNSERGIPGAIVSNVWKNSQRQWDRNIFIQGNCRKDLSDIVAIMANAKYSNDYLRYLNPDTTSLYVDNEFRQQELYASIATKIGLADRSNFYWGINVALDYQYNTLQSTMANFCDPQRNSLMSAIATQMSFFGIKAQANVSTTTIFDLTHSFRHGDNDRGISNSRRTAICGGIFINYGLPIANNLRLRGFIKRSFRMPSFNDLYYTDIGNAALNPENALQYDFGVTEREDFSLTIWKYFEIKADGYYNRVKDKIIAVPKGNSQYRWMMTNIGEVRILGVDINAEAGMNPVVDLNVGLRATYTFQRAMDYSKPQDNDPVYGTFKGQISYIPRHSGSAGLFADWRGFEINYSWLYVGKRWHNSVNISSNEEKAWMTQDIALAYTHKIGNFSLRIQAEINNLLNRQYQVILNYPMPGRNFRLSLTAEI